jgi:hypothetical protein
VYVGRIETATSFLESDADFLTGQGWHSNLLDVHSSKRELVEFEHPYAPKKSALSKKNRDIYTFY